MFSISLDLKENPYILFTLIVLFINCSYILRNVLAILKADYSYSKSDWWGQKLTGNLDSWSYEFQLYTTGCAKKIETFFFHIFALYFI